MKNKKIERKLVNYITNQASSSDIKFLQNWLGNPKNIALFNEFVKINYTIDYNLQKYDSEKTKEELLRLIRNDKIKRKRFAFNMVVKYAAMLIIILGIGAVIKVAFVSDVINNIDISNKDAITLELENGQIEVIHPELTKDILGAKGTMIGNQKNLQLFYTSNTNPSKLAYHTIKVPNGKRFDVILSDGTHVYLNAGSSLKYPVEFMNEGERKVFLNGEAYFDVYSDKKHPFIVDVNNMNVQALGTEFNISSYPEDSSISTVLVEGSVRIFKDKSIKTQSSVILKPGYKAEWKKETKTIFVKKVDTKIYTGWLDNKLIFKNSQFKNIIQKLERHYNVTIINKNKKLDKQYFDATFDVETIAQVLNSFKESYNIDYTIENDQIIIN
jgi:ferric-dicitrate binding protein FerR (iron transport regulator)